MHPGNPHPEKIRVAVIRAVEERGLTYAETAEMLGIGEASVSRICVVIAKLEALHRNLAAEGGCHLFMAKLLRSWK